MVGPSRRRMAHELVRGHCFTVLLDARVVGFVQWYENDDPEYRHAGIQVFIGAGRGLGQETVSTVLRHLVDDLHHHRVVIDPATGMPVG